MHLTILRARPDVAAVVHAHPPVATGFATAGQSVDCDCIPELIATVGRVPLVPYGTPGTPDGYSAVGVPGRRVASGHAGVRRQPGRKQRRRLLRSLQFCCQGLVTVRKPRYQATPVKFARRRAGPKHTV